ncbi:nucleotide exchange factor GrpE [Desulfofundulus sp.]|uniref:nucleotide exchange factor GrpE n=1 Tax=Desulfofundulus sp. TaxID=2282750 RepID=UPI003C750F15
MEEKKTPDIKAQNIETEGTNPSGADAQESPPAGESREDARNTPAGEEQQEGGPGQEVDVKELQQRLAEQTALAREYFERLARMQADFENYRRRVNREREEWFKYASQPLVTELLSVLDNFERALAAREEDPARVVAGVEMIYRQFKEILTREGLSPVPAVNEPFDPAKHEAIMQEETDAYPDNTVMEELRRGYYFKDRLLRPAMVKVARALSRPEEQKQEEKENNTDNNQTSSV